MALSGEWAAVLVVAAAGVGYSWDDDAGHEGGVDDEDEGEDEGGASGAEEALRPGRGNTSNTSEEERVEGGLCEEHEYGWCGEQQCQAPFSQLEQ